MKNQVRLRGSTAQWSAFEHLDPVALGLIPGNPKKNSEMILREKIVDVVQVNQQRCCLEQWTAEAW